MADTYKHKGPWLHRFLVGLFTIVLTLLVFWLLGFVTDDIGNLRGPLLTDVEKTFLSESLLNENKEIDRQLAETGRNISDQQHRQALLRDSTSGFQRTMNQLLEMQRHNLEKNVALPEPQQKALAESVVLFLANQKHDQELTEDIAKRSEEQRLLQEKKRGVDEKLASQRDTAQKEWNRLQRRHDLKLACLKLLFLLPILLVTVILFLKKRGGMYAPLVYATGAAVLWQTILVIHQHFPTRYFKYIILSAAIVIVVSLLVALLRAIRSPKAAILLKQYREAYEHFFCPVCEYPIRRGPLRYFFWTRRSLKKLAPPLSPVTETEPTYTCPACGSKLYEQCQTCKAVRHSLLPFCEKCGNEKALANGVTA